MNFIGNLRIGTRLGGGFGLLMLLIACVAASGGIGLFQVQEEVDLLTEDRVPKLFQLADIGENTLQSGVLLRDMVILRDPKAGEQAREQIAKARAANAEAVAEMQKTIATPRGKEMLADLVARRDAYGKALDLTLATIEKGVEAETRAVFAEKLRPAAADYVESIEAMRAYQNILVAKAGDAVDVEVKWAAWLMGGLTALAVLLGTATAWIVTRSVTRPIGTAMKLAETIAAGDLTSRIEVTSTDETGKLLASMKRMNESLQRIVGDVRSSADSIATGSTQIATGTQDLSARTEEQASNLEQTAASMEELTATVKQSGDSAAQANQLATTASAAAASGGVVVAKVVTTMERITTQSHKIAEIISVIDGIAFQTNILALNASVEAARAGEQGRGFAVVAGEVRNLAQRAAQAAKEIKTLINASVEQIESGGVLVQEAGRTMNEIVGQVKQVSDLIGEITAASKEESAGIVQINDAVTQLDQVTQQNAALVEQSAAAADSLRNEAQRLAHAVSVFRLAS